MHRSVNDLKGYAISAKDGELGKVSEFFFDDFTWSVRYLVVETGSWLEERKVIIPHAALGITDWTTKTFQVNLTMEQVRKSPSMDTQKTVSRRNEMDLFKHYELPAYWGNEFYTLPVGMYPLVIPSAGDTGKVTDESGNVKQGDPHLRSTSKVEGYFIHANDGEIGHVEDYIVDDEKWNILFIVVDTTNWLPGKKVLILPHWVNRIEWGESKVYINLTKKSIEESPEFNPADTIGKDYEEKFYNHYNKYREVKR